MWDSLIGRPRRVLVLACALAAFGAAGALAYFTSAGSGSGRASVGSSSPFTVNFNVSGGSSRLPVQYVRGIGSVGSLSASNLYPGSGSDTLSYNIENDASAAEDLASTTASIAALNGDITENGVEVPGCLQSWFQAANTPPSSLPQELSGGEASASGSVTVTMTDTDSDQDACQGASPDIVVQAS